VKRLLEENVPAEVFQDSSQSFRRDPIKALEQGEEVRERLRKRERGSEVDRHYSDIPD
jgi:hypothetical protein